MLRRKTDKQRPSVVWRVQVGGGQGEGRARDLPAGPAVLQLIVSGHVDTTDQRLETTPTSERERERSCDVKLSLIKQTDYVKMSSPPQDQHSNF